MGPGELNSVIAFFAVPACFVAHLVLIFDF
jgi:hypothetical protein